MMPQMWISVKVFNDTSYPECLSGIIQGVSVNFGLPLGEEDEPAIDDLGDDPVSDDCIW
jgi:hypothetical protein